MKKASVENMRSGNGNVVPNQFLIWTDDGTYFQSYQTVVAFRERGSGKIMIDRDGWEDPYKNTRTTAKYRSMFLREKTKDTERKIESGEYILTDLN